MNPMIFATTDDHLQWKRRRALTSASSASTASVESSEGSKSAAVKKARQPHARVTKAESQEATVCPTEEHEIDDAALVFETVWKKLELKYGRLGMKFPEECIFLMGAPGSGKGTHSAFIRQLRGLTADTVVISDILNSPEAAALKSKAELVADGTVLELLLEHLRKPQFQSGVIIDGFPRTHKQVAFVSALHGKINELHARHLGTELASEFTRPRFRMAVLYVSEKTSIQRQLARGKKTIAHNEEVEKTGHGEKWELRDTDVSEEAASKRYQIFTEHYDALFSLRETFAFKLVEADASVEEVQRNLAQEFEYQGSLELDQDTFQALCKLPLAADLSLHNRQKLIERLDGYQHEHGEAFARVLRVIEEKFLPIIQVHAHAGYCIIRSENEVFSRSLGRSMALDVLTERGFHITVDVIQNKVLESVSIDGDKAHPIFNICKVHVFHVRFPKSTLYKEK